jgi:hypothetical protein
MALRLSQVVVLCCLPILAAAGEVNRPWQVLMQSIEPGKTVVVTRMNSAQVEGKLLKIADDSITVQWKGQPQIIQRDDVFRVRKANIRRRHTLLCMAAGAGRGAVIGALSAESLDRNAKGQTTAEMAFGGLGLGAAVGGALPIGAPLYRAERPVKPSR